MRVFPRRSGTPAGFDVGDQVFHAFDLLVKYNFDTNALDHKGYTREISAEDEPIGLVYWLSNYRARDKG
jgi:hypothetical protein